jgi:predicted RNA-binding protein with PIN domain
MADSVAGADAMLRSGTVLLVVDGYNVSKTAGTSGSLAVERDSLVRSLEGFHLTSGVDVVVVFDGDGTQGVPRPTRRGVRVVFSRSEEEADSVVVEIVASTPLHTPVIVASSDHWVREHAETSGAVVVSAATLLGVLRKAPGRSAS